MSGLGKPLELAIVHAATHYKKQGRCALARQYPRLAWRDGAMRYASKAPIDFLGAHKGGRALAIEAKEINDLSLELATESGLSEDQRSACALLYRLGADVHVIVDVVPEREVYDLRWAVITTFLNAPWRRSLSLQWMRAYGQLLPEENRDVEAERRVLFLDGDPHIGKETAYLAVVAEKAKSPVIDLAGDGEVKPRVSKDADTFRAIMARKPSRDDPQAYLKWLDEYTAWDLEHQYKRAKQLRGRKTWGGRR